MIATTSGRRFHWAWNLETQLRDTEYGVRCDEQSHDRQSDATLHGPESSHKNRSGCVLSGCLAGHMY